MKTRIISGIIMGGIVAAVLALGFLWNTVVIALAIAALGAGAIYEILKNAASVKDKIVIAGACVYAALAIIMGFLSEFDGIIAATVIYGVFAAAMTLKNHAEFELKDIAVVYGLPIPFVFAFYFLCSIITSNSGIYYLLLLLNFSSVCDTGAYFTGVTCGKHKLCPNISPKKTIEGAIGGVVSSLVFTFIITLCFGEDIILPLLLTVPLCVLGMVGDLFASAIKRSVGLKDYGNLIPGHGGIMDRVDSIIMIAPLMFTFILWGIL